jgi:hypothetical protein
MAIFKIFIILYTGKVNYASFVPPTPLVTFYSGSLSTHVFIMMIASKVYRGIEYVHIAELPKLQREILTDTINRDLFIKILMDGNIVNDCLQFKDYSYWYNSVYVPKTVAAAEPVKELAPVEFGAKQLAFK